VSELQSLEEVGFCFIVSNLSALTTSAAVLAFLQSRIVSFRDFGFEKLQLAGISNGGLLSESLSLTAGSSRASCVMLKYAKHSPPFWVECIIYSAFHEVQV